MSEPKCFGKYVLLSQIDAKIVAMTPLRIGLGKEQEVTESDLPIIKNSKGIPILTASTLKGFFRANTERTLMNIKPAKEASKIIRTIFGSSEDGENASAIFFYNIEASKYKIENRKHIRIDPETGGARRGGLFEAECVMDGAEFEGHLLTTRNLSPAYIGIIKPVIELSSLGISRLGGFKSRGYGFIDIKINKLTLIIPGKTRDMLKQGIPIQPTIGTKNPEGKINPTYIKANNGGKVTLKEIEEISFSAKVEDAPSYLGTKITIESEEANKLLSSLANQFQKYITT